MSDQVEVTHHFVPGGDDSTFGSRGTWCAFWPSIEDQCGLPPEQHPEQHYDPYAHRRRLAFGRDDLAAILGLLPDVKIINVNLFREPLWVEVFVASERFPKHDDRLGGETRVEPVEFIQTVSGYGPGRMVHHPGQGEPVQHEVVFTPTWIEGWKMAIEYVRENIADPGAADAVAGEMETRLPE